MTGPWAGALGLSLGLAVLARYPAQAAPAPASAPTPPAVESCVSCHTEIGDARLEAPAKLFPQEDIHAAKGFGCTACHGGDPTESGMEAMDPAKGYIGKPSRPQVIQVCGHCHADAQFMKRYNPGLRVDQTTEYRTSAHGRRLQASDTKVAVCTSCHPAHSIKPPSDPKSSVYPLQVAETCGRCHADPAYMKPYGIPTDQLEKYKQSVHWNLMSVKGDLSAPTCNDCHGNHGATPPGVSWVGNVCGQCHSVMGELFAKSVHARAFTAMGTPGCATCHENHAIRPASDAMVGLGDKAVCATCHAADDKGGKTVVEIRGLLDSLTRESGEAHEILLKAERAGMEVSQAQFDLNGARDALVKARAAVHAFAVEPVLKEVEAGLAVSAKARTRGVRALDELQFRRRGLAVSLVIIVALLVGLVLKIRQIESRARKSVQTGEGRVDG